MCRKQTTSSVPIGDGDRNREHRICRRRSVRQVVAWNSTSANQFLDAEWAHFRCGLPSPSARDLASPFRMKLQECPGGRPDPKLPAPATQTLANQFIDSFRVMHCAPHGRHP